MYCAALPEAGLGLALKMDDGNNARACEVAVAALLQGLGTARSDAEVALLDELSHVTLRNWRGTEVGRVAVHPELLRTLPPAKAGNRCGA
jgi:L-asparaginase II